MATVQGRTLNFEKVRIQTRTREEDEELLDVHQK
ncbi:hypothetical protein J3R74_000206 [Puniceicoccus vermicola]